MQISCSEKRLVAETKKKIYRAVPPPPIHRVEKKRISKSVRNQCPVPSEATMPSASFTSSRSYVRRSRRKGNRIALPGVGRSRTTGKKDLSQPAHLLFGHHDIHPSPPPGGLCLLFVRLRVINISKASQCVSLFEKMGQFCANCILL